jgi:hypothetical protein
MRKLLLAATFVPLALPAYAAAPGWTPPTWTILRTVCWKISETAGQCAVGLYGSFATKEACLAANGGKLQANGKLTDGREVGQRCEMKLEGEF